MRSRAALVAGATLFCGWALVFGTRSDAGARNAWTEADVVARFKASAPDHDAEFGRDLAVSADGNLMAVALDGFENRSNWIEFYERSDDQIWVGPQRIQTNQGDFDSSFGELIEMSNDGSTVVVSSHTDGAERYDDAYGVHFGTAAGAVYVFNRSGTGQFVQQQILNLENHRSSDFFGKAIGLSGDGDWLAVGAPNRDAEMIPDNPADFQPVYNSGSVFLYQRNGNGQFQFRQQLRSPVPDEDDQFGAKLELSEDGSTIVVSSPGDDTVGSGVVPTGQLNNNGDDTVTFHVFRQQTNGQFNLEANLKSGLASSDPRVEFEDYGRFFELASDGNTMAVGSLYSVIDGVVVFPDPQDRYGGAVTLYHREGTVWRVGQRINAPTQGGSIDVPNNDARFSKLFGAELAFSHNGDRLAVGMTSFSERSRGGSTDAGAVFVYRRSADQTYEPHRLARLSVANLGTGLGGSVAFSADGRWLFAGAPQENSGGSGVNPDPTAGPVEFGSGAVYAYDLGVNTDYAGPDSMRAASSIGDLVDATDYRPTEHGDILRLYRAIFNREPDIAGAKYWIVDIYEGRGVDFGVVVDNIATDDQPEFVAAYADVKTNDAFVERVYQNMLGRPAEAGGKAYWVGLMDEGLSRAQTARWIAANAEFIALYPYQ